MWVVIQIDMKGWLNWRVGTILDFSKARIIQKWREYALSPYRCASLADGTGGFTRCPLGSLCGVFTGWGFLESGPREAWKPAAFHPTGGCVPGGRDTFLNSGEGPMLASAASVSWSHISNRNGIQQTCRIRTFITSHIGSYQWTSGLAQRCPQGPKFFLSFCSANLDIDFVLSLVTIWWQWLQVSHSGDRIQRKKRDHLSMALSWKWGDFSQSPAGQHCLNISLARTGSHGGMGFIVGLD